MFEKIFEKVTELSQLPAFSGGRTEHALFVILLVVIILACMTIIIFAFKTIQNLWSRLWNVYDSILKARTEKEQEYTKQLQASGKTSKSQF
ncbi:MAG: hypothetical protein NT085_00145 [candidate division SR1 bacterium]|nr:hypothetical protein [candidate division SR1 bacterium]